MTQNRHLQSMFVIAAQMSSYWAKEANFLTTITIIDKEGAD